MRKSTTRVWLLDLEPWLNVWLRFGRPIEIRNVDAHRRLAVFEPDEVFGRLWGAANEHGTFEWTFVVLRAVSAGEASLRMRGVEPGAQVLLRVTTPERVKAALRIVNDIENCPVHPADASPHYWRVVGARLAVNDEPPPYSLAAHRAYVAGQGLRDEP